MEADNRDKVRIAKLTLLLAKCLGALTLIATTENFNRNGLKYLIIEIEAVLPSEEP